MIFDAKTVAMFMPLLAALLCGLGYVFYGRALQLVNVQTMLIGNAFAGILTGLIVWLLFPAKIDLRFFASIPAISVMGAALFCTSAAWVCSLTAIQNISATYAAIGEISYPLFTAFFAYLIFRDRQLDWKMASGRALIAAGSYVIISGKMKVRG